MSADFSRHIAYVMLQAAWGMGSSSPFAIDEQGLTRNWEHNALLMPLLLGGHPDARDDRWDDMKRMLPRPLTGTPLAIIEAAERLFGYHGIEGVSLRQIRLEACANNNSAIKYHFSDRSKLIEAIWEYRLPVLDAARQEMLDKLRANGLEKDAREVLRVLVMPNYDLKDAHGVHRYAAFFRHAMRWQGGSTLRHARLNTTPASAAALELFYALRPDLPHEVLDYRLKHASCMFFDMIVERDTAVAPGTSVADEQEFLKDGIDMLVAACLR